MAYRTANRWVPGALTLGVKRSGREAVGAWSWSLAFI